MDLLVPIRTTDDLVAAPATAQRLATWATENLPAGEWRVVLAHAAGLPLLVVDGAESVTVPAWNRPSERRRSLDTVASGAEAAIVPVGTTDLDRLLLPGSVRARVLATAGRLPAALGATLGAQQSGPRQLGRRGALAALGLGVLAACGAAKTVTSSAAGTSTAGSSSAGTSSAAATSAAASSSATGTAADCTLATELTQGPYYLTVDEIRSDIREDRAGVPLVLTMKVQNQSCAPLAGASVDIWHADANGLYSGFVSQSAQANGTSSSDDGTFLRGTQVTAADGTVTFTTIVPGWYRGRTVHIHVMVHSSGKTVHTGQLFFDDTAIDTIFKASAPYSARSARDTRNTNDGIYNQGGKASTLTLTGDASGYKASISMGVKV